MRGTDPNPYTGPVPMITHVHGAHTYQESDGYPEAWYLPAANNIPAGYATTGTKYDDFVTSAVSAANGDNLGALWTPGSAVFEYPNDQRATTLWYHDHALGMTRLNVYAGPAGFYLLRGGPDDMVLDGATGLPAILPRPAPSDSPGGNNGMKMYYEIPIVIQDRSFNTDGSLAYPDNRAFFEGLAPEQLQIPFIPDEACDGMDSDVAPIWNPEFFGDTIVVNGKTWPFLNVEPRRYRLRFLNGCQARFLILAFDDANVDVWQIGADGGFLAAPVHRVDPILLGPAERADCIVDFSAFAPGASIILLNVAPDEPFGGGDFDPADPATTGQVMQFRVVAPGPGSLADNSTPPAQLLLPGFAPLVPTVTRQISLNEEESKSVFVSEDADGNVVLDCADGEAFGPTAALLGTVNMDGTGNPLLWMDAVTENPAVGAVEEWEIHNFTADAHPIHIHLVQFQIVNRQPFGGTAYLPGPEEDGFKDTVIAYPGEITRVKARFDIAGLFVWHCHILEHEDNEMMRPYRVGP